MTIETSPLTRKLSAFVALSGAELAVLERLHRRRKSFAAGRDLVHQGQAEQAAYILAAGWVVSYKIQPDGSRQIVDFQIPGDFLGLRSVLLHTSDHGIEPIVDIEAAEVLASDLLQAFAETPRLATAILWAVSRDEAMVVEHLVGLGRRDADARMAHFLLELGVRLSLVGIRAPPQARASGTSEARSDARSGNNETNFVATLPLARQSAGMSLIAERCAFRRTCAASRPSSVSSRASVHGSRPRRASADRTVTAAPVLSSPTSACRKGS